MCGVRMMGSVWGEGDGECVGVRGWGVFGCEDDGCEDDGLVRMMEGDRVCECDDDGL